MLPAWTSPWNGPWTSAASIHTLSPRRRTSSPSMPRAFSSSKRSIGVPYSRSMQITRGPHRSQYTSGAVIQVLSPKSPMWSRNAACRWASRTKFSSSLVTWWRSSTTPGAFSRCPVRVRSTSRARRYIIRRSRFMRSAMAGRWILSTARRPSASTHAWTWAIDAADSGTGSTSANSSPAGGAEVVLDDRQGLPGGERRHVVERAQAGVRERRGEHAGRRGDHLAELHERRAEGQERLDQPDAGRGGQRAAGGGVAPGRPPQLPRVAHARPWPGAA